MSRTKIGREVERLIDNGYTDPRILSQQTGLSERQCRRYLEKFQKEARYRFDNLMTNDYLHQYFAALDNYSRTIQQCNEEIKHCQVEHTNLVQEIEENMSLLAMPKQAMAMTQLLAQKVALQNNRETTITRLIAQRDKSTDLKVKTLNAGPVVFAMDQWIRDNNPKEATLPKLNITESNDNKTEELVESISPEDEQVLKEMSEEENE